MSRLIFRVTALAFAYPPSVALTKARPRREGIMRVRMGDDEATRWQAAAEAARHPSLSSWVRALADEAAATGSNGRAVAAALVALRADLAQGVGNNVNQLAKAANQGHGVSVPELAQAAREVEAARRAVSRALSVIRPPRVRATLP